jgi:predicted ArsR family transcriptional regulator
MTREAWLNAVEEARNAPLPKTDAITMAEFADMLGTTRAGATGRMRRLIAEGLAVQTKKPIRRPDGGVILVPAYTLTKKDAPKKKR